VKDNSESIFNMVLASTVHDMKNSLSMLGESLNLILSQVDPELLDEKTKDYHGVVQYESARVNNSLMQLLALYKFENEQLPFNPSYHNLSDFLEEQKLRHIPLLDAKSIDCEIDVDEEIEGIFDECLLSTVLENVIGNAIRYTKSAIKISCSQQQNTVIEIADDGPGYPEQMIVLAGDYMHGINQSTGSTGLGLFFAKKIASLHKHKEQIGCIRLSNGGELGGGRFELIIP
jgi:signal transduction histidine kinase